MPLSLGNISSFYLKMKAGTFQSSSASSNYDFVLILAISSGLNIIENTFLQNFNSYAYRVISLSRSFFSSTCSLFKSFTSRSWFLYLFCSFFMISRCASTSVSRFWYVYWTSKTSSSFSAFSLRSCSSRYLCALSFFWNARYFSACSLSFWARASPPVTNFVSRSFR